MGTKKKKQSPKKPKQKDILNYYSHKILTSSNILNRGNYIHGLLTSKQCKYLYFKKCCRPKFLALCLCDGEHSQSHISFEKHIPQ